MLFDLDLMEVIDVARPRRRAAAAEGRQLRAGADVRRRQPARVHRDSATDVRPIEITQPEGPSFKVDGHAVSWQKWRLRVGYTPREGLVLHQVGYEDRGRLPPGDLPGVDVGDGRPLRRPGADAPIKNVFDEGEYGVGLLLNPLTLGCDCLGEIHYFDGTGQRPGRPAGQDPQRDLHARGGLRRRLEAHRLPDREGRGPPLAPTRDLLLRHRRQLRVRLLLVPLSRRHDPVRGEAHRRAVDRGDRGRARTRSYGDHRGARASTGRTTSTSSTSAWTCRSTASANSVYEVDAAAVPPGPDNPYGNAWVTKKTLLARESPRRSG